MSRRSLFSRKAFLICGGALAVVTVGVTARAAFLGWFAFGVPAANQRAGTPANVVAPTFSLSLVAQGTDPLENPSGVITSFGYLNDFPPEPVEATKTEPDQNAYLAFRRDPGGPTPGYDYGHHFLFQGHENAADLAFVTRINLDVRDPAHRITLLTPVGVDGLTHFNDIDGSAFDPFTRTMLFTQEDDDQGGVIEIASTWPPHLRTLDGVFGKAGFEGIHPDNRGNVLIVEDSDDVVVNVDPSNDDSPIAAKQPNSFVYRLLPTTPFDLSKGGKLQALQVTVDGTPITFHADDPVGDTFSVAQLSLHTPGTSWPVRWVTIHDSAVDGFAAFDANVAAKAAGASPFKRPENAQYQPGTDFQTFFFCPTGDTNADSGNQPALAARGAWGSIFRVDIRNGAESGKLSVVVVGDAAHSSFDNLAFAESGTLLATEDRGDGLHAQLNRLDSIWAFNVLGGPTAPRRFVAVGRDTASLDDVALADVPGYQNEGDNEPTGLHVSDGSDGILGMQGTLQNPFTARAFFTQQHGKNQVWEGRQDFVRAR
ncbi:MAG TPA: alkaline phosphatase PhoX [Polyangiaceae bacterium]|jgi:hypothetical protein|nr:alkaline phosphatase PhoX [Polyangiaceae bacterium]